MEDRNCVPSAFIFDMLAKVFDPETLLERGREAREAGRPDEASDLFLQAVAEARWAGKPALLVHALMTQGRAARSMKRLEAALHSFHEAAALCSGNGGVEAEALLEIAAVLREQEKTAEAKAAYHRALDRIQSNPVASSFDEARCLQGLATLEEATNPEEAVLLWQGATSLYAAAQAHDRCAECQQHLAFLQCS